MHDEQVAEGRDGPEQRHQQPLARVRPGDRQALGPGERAGLQVGDVVVAVDGTNVLERGCASRTAPPPEPGTAVLTIDRAGEECAGKNCWKAAGPFGFSYKDKGASQDGVSGAKFLGGPAGKSKILVKAANNASKGIESLPTGIAARLVGAEQVTMQIQRHATRTCYSADLIDIKLATSTLFKAK